MTDVSGAWICEGVERSGRIKDHLKSKREAMEEEERQLREQLKAMMKDR